MFKILSASTSTLLEKEAEGYIITELGSLTIANGHYFLSFIGEPKVSDILLEEIPAIEKPKVTRRKRRPNTNV
jgi:hypothetical protein